MVVIERLRGDGFALAVGELIEILRDAVDGGASIGFLPPLAAAEAGDYFAGVAADEAAGRKAVWGARVDGRLVAMVQLAFEQRPNGRHRAEVQKLVVHSAYRQRGIGRQLMEALEAAARARGLRLLFLDTRQGDPAERLYRSMGYAVGGTIPGYVINGDGVLEATVYYYKLL